MEHCDLRNTKARPYIGFKGEEVHEDLAKLWDRSDIFPISDRNLNRQRPISMKPLITGQNFPLRICLWPTYSKRNATGTVDASNKSHLSVDTYKYWAHWTDIMGITAVGKFSDTFRCITSISIEKLQVIKTEVGLLKFNFLPTRKIIYSLLQ